MKDFLGTSPDDEKENEYFTKALKSLLDDIPLIITKEYHEQIINQLKANCEEFIRPSKDD